MSARSDLLPGRHVALANHVTLVNWALCTLFVEKFITVSKSIHRAVPLGALHIGFAE